MSKVRSCLCKPTYFHLCMRILCHMYSCDAFFGPYVLYTLRRYFCPWRTLYPTYICCAYCCLWRTLNRTYICCTYFCPWRTVVLTYCIPYVYFLYVFLSMTYFCTWYFIPYVHLLYVLLCMTYFCPYVLYNLRTFAIRTFVHDVLLSIIRMYFVLCVHLLYVLSSYVHLLTYIWHTNISDTNFGP